VCLLAEAKCASRARETELAPCRNVAGPGSLVAVAVSASAGVWRGSGGAARNGGSKHNLAGVTVAQPLQAAVILSPSGWLTETPPQAGWLNMQKLAVSSGRGIQPAAFKWPQLGNPVQCRHLPSSAVAGQPDYCGILAFPHAMCTTACNSWLCLQPNAIALKCGCLSLMRKLSLKCTLCNAGLSSGWPPLCLWHVAG